MEEGIFLHALRTLPKLGNQGLKTALEYFGNAEALWNAPIDELKSIPGIAPKTASAFERRSGAHLAQAKKDCAAFAEEGIRTVGIGDTAYPALLAEIPDAPAVLYYRGAFGWEAQKPMVAIVGSRKYTAYGEQAASRLAEDLARLDIVVVSGLAFGIDALAHRAALESGETIAVLGGGIDDRSIAPQTHIPLSKEILRNGALVSEYPPGTMPSVWTFPQRNRIIAGMALGTLVIEAAEKSGSLITARLALDYNREVFAVPGSIFSPASSGTNRLIKEGAKIVRNVSDIAEELGFLRSKTAEGNEEGNSIPADLSEEERVLLSLLSHEPLHVDKIFKAATLETAVANSALTMLEIKGIAKNVGGMNYIRTN